MPVTTACVRRRRSDACAAGVVWWVGVLFWVSTCVCAESSLAANNTSNLPLLCRPAVTVLTLLLLLLVAGVYDGKGCSGSAQFVEDHAVVLVGHPPDHKGYSLQNSVKNIGTIVLCKVSTVIILLVSPTRCRVSTLPVGYCSKLCNG